MKSMGLYIHIPFCSKKCAYCDFLSFGGTSEETKDMYIKALVNEIRLLKNDYKNYKISSLYIGGGTPSILSVENYLTLMKVVNDEFEFVEGAEKTIEINPGTLSDELLRAYVSTGINRISMGLQSDDDEALKELGRIHDYHQFLETYQRIQNSGIKNMNIDVMFGLSNQSLEQWEHTLETIINLAPKHISAYSLIIEEDTEFELRLDEGVLNLPDEDLEREMFWRGETLLETAGYHHYEISNYAQEGYEAKHNSSYWTLHPYLGVGLGASSYYKGQRYKNITDLDRYIKANGSIEIIRELEQEGSEKTQLEEIFFLGLRLLKGLDLNQLKKSYEYTSLEPYLKVVEKLIEEELLIEEDDKVHLTPRGVDISNHVLAQFLIG